MERLARGENDLAALLPDARARLQIAAQSQQVEIAKPF
jgi:hypothetical protein